MQSDPTKTIREMLVEIRNIHFDITPVIKEELAYILPSIIEDIVRNFYQIEIVKSKQ